MQGFGQVHPFVVDIERVDFKVAFDKVNCVLDRLRLPNPVAVEMKVLKRSRLRLGVTEGITGPLGADMIVEVVPKNCILGMWQVNRCAAF